MDERLQWLLIVLGLVAIAALGALIYRQSRTLRAARQSRDQQDAYTRKRREECIQSIRVLAMTIEQNQVEYSEACIRIKGLLDYVAPELLESEPYAIFQKVYEETRHMPTHEARLETDRRFIRKLDKQRFAIERRHQEAIRAAATAIRHYPFEEAS